MSTIRTPWLARFDNKGVWAPFWLGFIVTLGFLLLRCVFDLLFLLSGGFPEGSYPLWQSDVWWPEIVNATMLGYIPAAFVVTRQGFDRDLDALRPWLSGGDTAIADIRSAAFRPAGVAAQIFRLLGLLAGLVGVFLDPTLTAGTEPSLANPNFLWSAIRIPIFIWLVLGLIVSDLNVTRAYRYAGRNLIEVDLLDVQSLAPFARKGLRSAFMWVLFLVIFSLFWLGEGTAARQNPTLFVMVLTMASIAFIIPLAGVHDNILSVKRPELNRLREEIRLERVQLLDQRSDGATTSPRLANLVTYYQLIEQTREWPIDAANLLRFIMYLLIGLGSWLGGAVVERLLDSTLAG
jgi:hypothetical protein